MDKDVNESIWKEMKSVKILFIMPREIGIGGIETVVLAYWKELLKRGHQVDFICHGYERGDYDDEIEKMGSLIYRVPIKSQNLKGTVQGVSEVLEKNEYDVVHAHMNATCGLYLKIAKKNGVQCRVAHSHCSSYKAYTNNWVKILINELEKVKTRKYATDCLACSDLAGRWLYGRRPFKIVRNGVDIERYRYNVHEREVIRQELNIQRDEIVLGHVGGFVECKNHDFLIEVFEQVYRENDKYRLILIGDGQLQQTIKDKVKEKQMKDKVIFLGQRNDVWRCLQAMDIFLLPSLSEGAPVAAIEAQANGLKCVFSNKIPLEVFINNTTISLGIDEENKYEWVKECLLPAERTNVNNDRLEQYNWPRIVDELEDLYKSYQ